MQQSHAGSPSKSVSETFTPSVEIIAMTSELISDKVLRGYLSLYEPVPIEVRIITLFNGGSSPWPST
jgi:hypothetical protein